jgi:excisionase family DNA binding protein
MTSQHDELTPGQAADLLNVSRSYLDRLLEQGDIPARNRGGQCRLRLRDVLEYKARSQRLRARCLDALTAQAQDLDMGY